MKEQLNLFGKEYEPSPKTKTQESNRPSLIQFLDPFYQSIKSQLSYTSPYEKPKIKAVNIDPPSEIWAFHRKQQLFKPDTFAHFYTDDKRILKFLNNPISALNELRQYSGVIGPDISIQPFMLRPEINYIDFVNKMLTAWWQMEGITVIPNICWLGEDMYDQFFDGFPQNSVIAINSTGVRNDPYSKEIWIMGYREAVQRLSPTCILRYGAKQPGEYTDISIYYQNDNKKSATYGR